MDLTRDVSDVTHRKRGLRFEKSQLVEIETWARSDEFVRYGRRTWWGADGKVRMEGLYLSPYVEKPFNSKVIKSFVSELKSRKCFFVSGFLCYICALFLCYICIYIPMLYLCVMNILCLFHISVSRIWYINSQSTKAKLGIF